MWRSQGDESFPNMAGWPRDSCQRLASNQLHLATSWATPLKGRLEWSQVICLWFDEKNSGRKGRGGENWKKPWLAKHMRLSAPAPLRKQRAEDAGSSSPVGADDVALADILQESRTVQLLFESHRLWKETHYQTARERGRERKDRNQTTGWLCVLCLQTWARHTRSLQPSLWGRGGLGCQCLQRPPQGTWQTVGTCHEVRRWKSESKRRRC